MVAPTAGQADADRPTPGRAGRQGIEIMNNFLLFIGGLIVLILGALFAVPMFVDWNSYRGVFEEEASRLIGREVRVNGAVSLRLLPTPTVRFESVRVADTAGQTGEPFFRAGDFTLHLAVAPLLQGTIEATDIELKRPVLRIAFDEQGGANWRGLRRGDQRGFTPNNVALPSIKVTDGVLVVHGRTGDEKLRLEHINGEIGAPGLEGPYKARLTFTAGGSEQEARIATARAEEDGLVRFKATLRSIGAGASWALDGRLYDFQGRPSIKGDVTAKLPMSAGLAGAPRKAGAGEDAFDLKAALAADAGGFEVSDLAMTFEQDGRPQLLSGAIKGMWRDATALDASFASHWLDLDRIAGNGQKTLLGVIGRLADGLDWLPRTTRISVKTTIEQASLGGDVASNLVLALDRADQTITVRELRAAVPGGTRFEARGLIAGAGTPEQRFDGEAIARGASLARALGWAFRGLPVPEIARDGPYGVRAKVSIAAKEFSANDIFAELNGNGLNGSLSYSWGDASRLSVAVDGAEIDAGAIVIGDLGLAQLVAAVASGAPVHAAASSLTLPSVIRTRLNAGRLLLGDRSFRDVTADITLEAAGIGVDTLRLATDDGLGLELSGRIATSDARPKGSLGWLVTAASPAAAASAMALLGLPAEWQPASDRIAMLTPLRVAGTVGIGQRNAEARDIGFDGIANGSRVAGTLRLDASPKGLADSQTDFSIEMANPEVAMLLRQLLPAQAAAISERFGQGRGRLHVKGMGRIAAGVLALALLEAPGLAGEYAGRVGLANGRLALEGDARINGELARALAVAGLGARPGYQTTAIRGSARLLARDGAVRIDGSALQIGGAEVSARAHWPAAGDTEQLQVDVRASEVTVAGLLGLLLDGRGEPKDQAQGANAQSAWPDSAFELSILDRLPTTLRLETGQLKVAPGLLITDAALDIKLGGGKAAVSIASAKAAGGSLTGKLVLLKSSGGAELAADLRASGVNLALLAPAPAGQPAPTGKANVDVRLAGKAVGLRGLITSLEGKGQVELGAARLVHISPAALADAVAAAVGAKEQVGGADLRRQLAEKIAAGELVVGPRRLPLEIVEGQARLASLLVDTPEGRIASRSLLDLDTLRLDSEWRVELKAGAATDAKRAALPPVSVQFTGPLAALGSLQADVKADALEREITVRRMEREVEELERLRKEDQERARREAERLKALESQQPAAPAPAQPSQAPAPISAVPAAAPVPVPLPVPVPAQPSQAPAPISAAPAAAPVPAPLPVPAPAPVAAPAAPPPPAASDIPPKNDAAPGGGDPKSALPPPPAPRPAKRPQAGNPFRQDSGG